MRVGGRAEILDEQVRVRSEGDADVTVPHEALDAVRVHSAAEQLGCEGVAQVVEADGNVQGDGPEPPSAWIGEWTAPPIGDLAARRTEARLRIAGAFPVGAPATAVFVTFNDAGAGQGVPEVKAILDHLGLPSTGPPLAPARFIAGPVEETWQDEVPVLQQSLR